MEHLVSKTKPQTRPQHTPPRRRLELVRTAARGKSPQYLSKRGTTYYFVRKIPADALEAFHGHSSLVTKSLGTALLEKAKVLLAVEVTEFDLTLANHRRQRAADSAEHADASVPRLDRIALVGQVPALGPQEQERLDLVRTLEANLAQLRSMTVGATSEPGVKPRQSFPAAPQPRSVAAGRPLGRLVPGFPATEASARNPRHGKIKPTMLHLFEDWKRKQTRPRTINAVAAAVLEFRELHGPMPVESLNRQHARDYRDQLIERQLAKRTVENRLGFLATLMRHGMTEMVEHLSANPFERIDLTGAKGKRPPKNRRAYAVRELNLLFASKLYTGQYCPGGQALEAAYWVPLLGPFVGARIEELCQVRIEDVQRVNGVWCLRICDLDEQQKIKNVGSFRRVPLHETVIRCGFLVHVAAMAAAGHSRVFPSLKNENVNTTFSNALGKWYGRYLETIGLSDKSLDYHSFRYAFRQQCSLCGIENEVRDALTGHWVSKTDSGRTYMKAENRQYPFPKLVTAMKELRYDELRMSHLFVPEPMAGVELALLR
jgi:integrase